MIYTRHGVRPTPSCSCRSRIEALGPSRIHRRRSRRKPVPRVLRLATPERERPGSTNLETQRGGLMHRLALGLLALGLPTTPAIAQYTAPVPMPESYPHFSCASSRCSPGSSSQWQTQCRNRFMVTGQRLFSETLHRRSCMPRKGHPLLLGNTWAGQRLSFPTLWPRMTPVPA